MTGNQKRALQRSGGRQRGSPCPTSVEMRVWVVTVEMPGQPSVTLGAESENRMSDEIFQSLIH